MTQCSKAHDGIFSNRCIFRHDVFQQPFQNSKIQKGLSIFLTYGMIIINVLTKINSHTETVGRQEIDCTAWLSDLITVAVKNWITAAIYTVLYCKLSRCLIHHYEQRLLSLSACSSNFVANYSDRN